jgi:hypothetical protein
MRAAVATGSAPRPSNLRRPASTRRVPLHPSAVLILLGIAFIVTAPAVACSVRTPPVLPESRVEFPGLDPFAARFDADRALTRIVLILSPT